jgi:hypothetical protein
VTFVPGFTADKSPSGQFIRERRVLAAWQTGRTTIKEGSSPLPTSIVHRFVGK